MATDAERFLAEAEQAADSNNPAMAQAKALMALAALGLRDGHATLPNGDKVHKDGTLTGVRA